MQHEIDATNQKLGRVAAKAAKVLIGKTSTSFAKNKVEEVKVKIINASKLSMDEKKKKSTIHTRYSGYPGGLKKENAVAVISKKGYRELIKVAVWGMLPKNKLRTKRMLNLEVLE